MKRLIALTLAIALLTLPVPALAHEANYPKECEDRSGLGLCETDDDEDPAHKQCTGYRYQSSNTNSENPMVERFFSVGDETVGAYIFSPDRGDASGSDPLSPGLIWIETNGFDKLQRTDYECKSQDHENPNEWVTHADKVLI
jgi:hypothetical protein